MDTCNIEEINRIIEKVSNLYPYKEAGNSDSYSSYNEGWSDACDILGEEIKCFLRKKILVQLAKMDEKDGLYDE
jgi:hypothetical protein